MRTDAIVPLSLLMLLPGPLAGQVRVGQRLPDGQTVTVDQSVPPTAPSADELRDRCQARIDDARRALEARRWHDARRRLVAASRYALTPALRREVRGLLGQLESTGRRMLAEADRLWDRNRFDEARTAYRRVVYCMGELPCGLAARRELAAIENDPDLKAHRRQTTARRVERGLLAVLDAHAPVADANGLLRPVLDDPDAEPPRPTDRRDGNRPRAGDNAQTGPSAPTSDDEHAVADRPARSRLDRIASLSIERQERVVGILERLAESFPETSPGQRAVRDLSDLREAPALAERIEAYRAVRRLRREMQLIRNYHLAGRLDKALPRARKLVREHPDSPVADEARAWIESVTSAP